ncbi:MAG: peptidase domain-containing ABC transporter [Bacteroidales bacterium]|nr:MAG: peptidase domain-containing ABC transporter [Bacteroidales bacterium]
MKQQDYSDCGVACLISIINYFGGKEKPEKLRELSGTSKQGTTMLGLYQAACQSGFIAQGLQADIKYLNKVTDPVILHINIENKYNHYVVCYGRKENKYIIGNPATGIEEYTREEIDEFWQSKVLLKLYPGKDFIRKEKTRALKLLWLKELIKSDINILSASLFLGIIISVLGLVLAVFSQKLIDDILPNSRKNELITGLILIIFLLFVRAGLLYIHRFFGIKQGREFNIRIINRFYSNLLRLPKSFFDGRLTGDLVARMNDTKTIQQTIAYIINSLILNLLILIVSGAVIFIYSLWSGIIVLSAMPVYFLIAWLFHEKIVIKQRAVMEAHSKSQSNYINSIQGIDIIKSTNKEDFFSDINKLVFGFYQYTIFKLGKTNINLGFLTDTAGVIFSIALLSVNSMMVINNIITIGVLTAILGISSAMLPSIATLAFANLQLQGARIAFDRMFEFAGLRKEYGTDINIHKPLKEILELAFQDISFRFPGRKQLFKDVSFKIRKGEMITLFGENGCGKTTILNIIQRYYYPERGKYLINNTDIKEIYIRDLRTCISVVPQAPVFFSGSVIENICLSNDKEEIQNVLKFCKRFGFERYIMQFPRDYLTMLGEDGINISAGQQQLISIARALYRNPQVLLLDEPTSSMDRETEIFTLDVLTKYRSQSMIILVTHNISSAKESDRIYIINKGKIEQSGSHKELISAKNIYSMSYNSIMN